MFNLRGKMKGSNTVAGLVVVTGSLYCGGSQGGGVFKGHEYTYR